MGLSVSTPDLTEALVDWSKLDEADIVGRKGRLIRRHTANIETARCVLVANFAKNGIDNYIGANTFLEMVVAFSFESRSIFIIPCRGKTILRRFWRWSRL